MSNNNYNVKLLKLKDKNISVQAVEEEKYKNYQCCMVYATLTYTPEACECCEHVNQQCDIVKNGLKYVQFFGENHWNILSI